MSAITVAQGDPTYSTVEEKYQEIFIADSIKLKINKRFQINHQNNFMSTKNISFLATFLLIMLVIKADQRLPYEGENLFHFEDSGFDKLYNFQFLSLCSYGIKFP